MDSGDGCFLNITFEDNSLVETYTGDVLSTFQEAKQRADSGSNYVFGKIDAHRKLTSAAYIQDCIKEEWYNARIEFIDGARSYRVLATKRIERFDEIFIDYGYHWTTDRIALSPWIEPTIRARASHYVYPQSQVLYLLSNTVNRNKAYFDSGATSTVINDINSLYDVSPITPFSIGGITGDVKATHIGRVRWLPHKYNQAYYVKDLAVNLISLGYLQVKGASYTATTTSDGRCRLDIFDGPNILASSYMAPNRLYPASTKVLNNNLLVHNTLPSLASFNSNKLAHMSAPCITHTLTQDENTPSDIDTIIQVQTPCPSINVIEMDAVSVHSADTPSTIPLVPVKEQEVPFITEPTSDADTVPATS